MDRRLLLLMCLSSVWARSFDRNDFEMAELVGTTQATMMSENEEIPPEEINCPMEGFYAVQSNCRQFYRCVAHDPERADKFNVYRFTCPQGTVFDDHLMVCNHPEWVYPARSCGGAGGMPVGEPANLQQEGEGEQSGQQGGQGGQGGQGQGGFGNQGGQGQEGQGGHGGQGQGGQSGNESQGGQGGQSQGSQQGGQSGQGGHGGHGNRPPQGSSGPETPDEQSQGQSASSGMDMTTLPPGCPVYITTTAGMPTTLLMTTTAATVVEDFTTVPPVMTTTEIPTTTVQEQDSELPEDVYEFDVKCRYTKPRDRSELEKATRHPLYCDLYYLCIWDHSKNFNIVVRSCAKGELFDEKSQKCVPSESAEPCKPISV